MSSLIGRQAELEVVRARLGDPGTRLMTLTGPGGVGKTTLALRAAHDLADSAKSRVVVVELADVAAADLTLPAIAAALGIAGGPNERIEDALAFALSGGPTLLVLDNFERVAAAATALAALLERCPTTTALVSSRVPLDVECEHVVALGGLDVPAATAPLDELRRCASVELFLRDLEAAGVPPPNAPELTAIADVCRELGGLPLALRLAAARCVVLPPVELLHQLRRSGPVNVLARGPNDAPGRQHDLRATIAWSLDLLNGFERQLVDAVATFAGWCTWQEIGAVIRSVKDVPDGQLLDGMTTLVRHHLVESRLGHGARWFRLHPFVRSVVAEMLAAGVRPLSTELIAGHDAETQRFARAAAAGFDSASEPAWLEALDRRHDDLRATLARAADAGSVEVAAALLVGLAPYWVQFGGIDRNFALADALLTSPGADSITPADRSGLIAWRANVRSEWSTDARELAALAADFDLAMTLAESSGDARAVHRAALLSVRGAALVGHDPAAERHCRRALEVARAVDDDYAEARLQVMLCLVLGRLGRPEEAVQVGAAGLQAAQRLGADAVLATAIMLLVQLPPGTSGLPAELPDAAAALRHATRAGDRRTMCIGHALIAGQALQRGDLAAAAAACAAGIRLAREIGHHNAARLSLMLLTMTCAAGGKSLAAARIHGGLAEHFTRLTRPLPASSIAAYTDLLGGVERQLGPAEFAAQAAAGRALQWPDLIDEALAATEAGDPVPPSFVAGRTAAEHPLTDREVEVLVCVATGMSNKQIANALAMSAKTAMHHTTSIYRKLGVSSRAAATAWAYRSGLIDA